MENLFLAWREFRRGKKNKPDVQEFEFNLEDNIFQLHEELKNKTYRHSHYISFYVRDPKLRRIHKACVKDRVLHHAVFRILYPIFDQGFIFDSYSCRKNKGTHRAINRLEKFCRQLSQNNHKNIFALKCDVRKFFASIDHEILLNILREYIADENTMWLLEGIIGSHPTAFSQLSAKVIKKFPLLKGDRGMYEGISCLQRSKIAKCTLLTSPPNIPLAPHQGGNEKISSLPLSSGNEIGKGLPLGNVTSQLFANIYLNELDQFIKHKLKIKYYLRYCDDFLILGQSEDELKNLVPLIRNFFQARLKLSLHPKKIIIRKYNQGIDFLGYVVLPHYRVLRTKTKRRIFRKMKEKKGLLSEGLISRENYSQSLQSYLGVLKHCCGYKIKRKIREFDK